MAILNLQIPKSVLDVNVTPDKRTVLLHCEKALINGLKETFATALEPARNTFQILSTQQERRAAGMVEDKAVVDDADAGAGADARAGGRDVEEEGRSGDTHLRQTILSWLYLRASTRREGSMIPPRRRSTR